MIHGRRRVVVERAMRLCCGDGIFAAVSTGTSGENAGATRHAVPALGARPTHDLSLRDACDSHVQMKKDDIVNHELGSIILTRAITMNEQVSIFSTLNIALKLS